MLYSSIDKSLFPFADINRKANEHPKPNGLVDSGRSVRFVKTTCCVLCGGCDNISPWRKKLTQEGSRCASSGPDQARISFKIRDTNTSIIKTPKKIIIWISRFPKVKLCDIARICDAHAHAQGCGYVVPDVLKNKVVRCFKRDLSAGLRLEPSCSGGDKHGGRETAHARSSESYHRAQSGKNYCQSQTDHQQRHTATENSINSPTSPALESGASETSTNVSASLSLGKHGSKGVCRADMLDRDVAEDPREGGDDIAAGRRGTKRKRLGDSVRDRFMSSIADLESFSPRASATADTGGREEVDSGVGCSDASDTPVKIHCSHWKDGGVDNDPVESDASQKSSRLFSVMLEKDGVGTDSSDGDTEDLEQSSCQRVMVYFKLQNVSCARTCMSWPFPKCSPASVTSTGVETHIVVPIYPLAGDCNDTSVNHNSDPPVSLEEKTSAIPTNAITAINLHVSPHRKERNGEDGRQELNEEGEHIGEEKDGERSSDKCSYTLDGPSGESASLLPEAKEPVANPLSKTAIPPVPRGQKEPDLDTISGLPTPSDGSGADNHFSIPSPEPASTLSPMGLSNCDTTAASPPTSISSIPENRDSLSATPSSFTPSFPLNKVKLVDSAYTPPTSSSSSPKHMAGTMENSLLVDEETVTASLQLTQSSAPDSSLILPLEKHESEEDIAKERSQLKTEKYHNQLPTNDDLTVERGTDSSPLGNAIQQWLKTGMNVFIPQPLLSPIASPPSHSITSLLLQTQSYSDEEHCNEEEQGESKTTSGNKTQQMVTELLLGSLSFSTDKVNEEDCKDIDDDEHQEDEEEDNGESQQVPSEPKTNSPLGTGVPTEPSHSNEEDDDDDEVDGRHDNEGQLPCNERTCPSEMESLSDREEEEATSEADSVEAAEHSKVKLLDEFTAYEQDILLVDVIQDDPDLFGNLPKESLLKLGPTRIGETPRSRTLPSRAGGPSGAIERR